MRILHIDPKPLHRLRYLNARKGGGGVEKSYLAILQGRADRLPDGVQAVLVASDLQGVVPSWRKGENHLLGEELAEVLADMGQRGVVPPAAATGVLLAGDLYSAPGGDKRGATGDVRSVWRAFADSFAWVLGVAGNHDTFGTDDERAQLARVPNVHLLDTEVVQLGGVRFAGVQHIMGDPSRQGRVSSADFLASIDLLLAERPDVLLLHEGPHVSLTQQGSSRVSARLLAGQARLTLCGHRHWDEPLAELGEPGSGLQVLNVDARAVLLTA